ncbi:MAG: LptF/LptG family permease, partial [Bacteroidia bacterium]|nr:LptF/LptG family permease [Bacteroidia bacterium]
MKILDRYILTTYLKTFISVFVILMLIFVLQAVWLYISELAGKDLDIAVVAKFLLYITPTLIPLILPLTILLTSIMVFGNFAENYEFAAMKSTGISLQRAMRSLSVFIFILGATTFFFSNNVIPWAQYNSYNLRKNIAKLKPAMAIAEGQFNDIGNINIKVAEKSGDRGQYLKDVVIHKKSSSGIGNYTTILSKTGELASSEESEILKLILFDGWYYDDIQKKDFKEKQKRPFAKSEFKKYTINVDLSEINNINLDEKKITSKYDMLGLKELDFTIDSLVEKKSESYKEFSVNLYNRSGVEKLNANLNIDKDSIYTNEIAD